MRARFLIENPGGVEMTMKITMPLKEWMDLRDQLPSGWPATNLYHQISQMVSLAQTTFYPVEEPDKP